MRVKGGTVTHARRKRILQRASGYFGSKHLLFKTAKEQVMHSLRYAYVDRRNIKRDYRRLCIRRINAACRMNDISYSKFMHGLKVANVNVNRKMLSELAIHDPKAFAELVETAKKALKGEKIAPAKAEKKSETKKTEVKETKKEKEDLSSKSLAELKEMAKEKDIKGYSTMKKDELISALK